MREYSEKLLPQEFHSYDGTEKTVTWVNTAKKDCWTDEMRARASHYRRTHRQSGKKGISCFTSKVRCGICGRNYTGRTCGGRRHWRCGTVDESVSLRDDLLRNMSAEVLGPEAFDESVFEERIDYIRVDGDRLTFHFRDGHEACRK